MLHTDIVTGVMEAPLVNEVKSAQRPPVLLRLLPSLTDMAFLSPLLLLFLGLDGVKSMLGDGDTGWHIRAGEWMLANGTVPTQDIFSFTMSTSPWFAWEWLADIIMALAHRSFGLAGPVYLGILTLCLTSVLLFRLCCRYTNNHLIAFAITVTALTASSLHWLARPHLYTLLFLVISLDILNRAKENPKLLWIFPPFVVLWANLHGAFLVAPILLVTVGVGNFLERLTGPENRGLKSAWSKVSSYFLVALVSSLATVINPYGIHLHTHIYEYLTERYHFEHIVEFQTISFHASLALFYEALIVLGLMAAAWSLVRRRFADVLLLLSWLHFSLVSGRNIPIYVILASPIIVGFLTDALSALKRAEVASWLNRAANATCRFGSEFSAIDRLPRLHLVSAVCAVMLFIVLLGAPADARKLKSEYDTKAYPAGALHLLKGKRVFTNDEWGDYLIYKLYPEQKVFVDGRSDFYGPKFSLKYLDAINGHWDWASTLSRYGVDAVLLPVDSPLVSTLKSSRGWKAVHDDHISILFFATSENHAVSPVGKSSLNSRSEVHKAGPNLGSVLESRFTPALQHPTATATTTTLKEVIK